MRKAAYTELVGIFKSEDPTASSSSAFAKHAAAMVPISKDTHQLAFQVGVDCMDVFLERYDKAGDVAAEMSAGVVLNGFKLAKPKVVEKCRKIIVGEFAIEKLRASLILSLLGIVEHVGDQAMAPVFDGVKSENPKIPIECVNCIREVVHAFGLQALPLKSVIATTIPNLDTPNKKLRDAAFKLFCELLLWLGSYLVVESIVFFDEHDRSALLELCNR